METKYLNIHYSIYERPPASSFKSLTPSQIEELEEVFYTGSCQDLALTLHYMFGFMIEAEFHEFGLDHAWVRLPDGHSLDICGMTMHPRKPTHTGLNATEFLSLWDLSDSEPVHQMDIKDVPLKQDIQFNNENFELCKRIVNEYLLPTYNFCR